jgi:N-acetyl-S-(2-succino)cysteine monooxygenase
MGTATTKRMMHLNMFMLGVGHGGPVWRSPRTEPERLRDIDFYIDIARTAERGLFDAIFLSDNPSLLEGARYLIQQPLEPLTWLSALAVATERIGLIGSSSTTFNHPFNVARQFASLDHISRGRAAWNIVTTSSPVAARNFGLDESPNHDWRYVRAAEFVDVATKLWDSWLEGSEVFDRQSGDYLDMSRVREIWHEGPEFRVRGPMSIQRPPQGYPVFYQAGTSESGKDFAAQYAEGIFTVPADIDVARSTWAEMKQRAARYGRPPSTPLLFPSLMPILGSTEVEARQIQQELLELNSIDATIRSINNGTAGIDLSRYDLDGPFPDLGDVSAHNGTQSALETLINLAQSENLTVRQVIRRFQSANSMNTFVGTPEQLVEHMALWFETEACDGYMLSPPYFPESLTIFVDHVVPLLQARGLYRTQYEGSTLRDHLGLPYPPNQYDENDSKRFTLSRSGFG